MRFPRLRSFGVHLWHRVTFKRTREALKHIMTGPDGETYVPGRFLWVMGSLEFLGLAAHHVVIQGKDFDATAYGTGLSAILIAGGAGVFLSAKKEEK